MTATELYAVRPWCRVGGEAALIIKQEAEMSDLNFAVDKWNEQTAFIRSRFHIEHLTVTEMVARFSEIQNAVILEENMASNVQDKINELKQELEQIQRNLAESHQQRQRLLDQANAKTEAEFYQLLALEGESRSRTSNAKNCWMSRSMGASNSWIVMAMRRKVHPFTKKMNWKCSG